MSNLTKIQFFGCHIGCDVRVTNDKYVDGGYDGKILGVSVHGILVEHPKGSDGYEKFDNCTLLLSDNEPPEVISNHVRITIQATDILRTMGMVRPFSKYSIENLVEMGWLKTK